METWSFDRAVNKAFRLLPKELCPRSTEKHIQAKPLSGIEHLMESHATPLLVLPQSKFIENTARFFQDKINMEKCGRDWICSQNLVSSLTQTKFYKSQSQYFPTDNILPLESEASLLDLSSKVKCSTPMKNLEIWEKRARKLIASSSIKYWSNPFHCQSYHAQTFQWKEGWSILWNNGKRQTTSGSSIVQNGFKIPFKSVPPLSVVPINRSQSSSPLLQEESAELLKKQAVERVQNLGTPRFYSGLFLVPKKTGKLRPLIDLSLLNQYINKQHFKMETVKSVRQSIIDNNWAVFIDLTDAYLHIPIHPISRKYLRFIYDHQVFQFTALFGMSLSPWVFTKLMNVIATHLRLHAVSLFPYLEDLLIRDPICN